MEWSDEGRQKALDWVRKAERMYAIAEGHGEKRRARIIQNAVVEFADHDNPGFLNALRRMKRTPWTIEEFLGSKEFLGGDYPEYSLLEIWPALIDDIKTCNPDCMAGEKPVHEALLGGATGTGKSTVGLVTTLNQALLLTCFKEPQRLFKLPAATQIVFALASYTTTTTKRAIYTPMRKIFEHMPYVKKNIQFDKRKEGEIDIADTNVIIAPVLATVQSIMGQAIIGGAIDEINFFSIVEQSKMVAGPAGQGGRWDQAEELYNTMSRRRKSRFTSKGMSFGALVVSSSTRYEGDFLDRRIDQVREMEEPNILTYRHAQYDVQPQEKYSGKKIRVLVGTDNHATRVLKGVEPGDEDYEEEGVHYPVDSDVRLVPQEYEFEFKKDPENALRDVIGIATKAIKPFFSQRHKIIEAMLRGRDAGMKPMVLKQDVDYIADGMPQIDEANLPDDRDNPRAIHVDLSETNDRCGIAMAKISGWEDIIEKDHRGNEIVVTMPRYAVEMAISIQPNPMKPLDISDVRIWILQLSKFYGFNIASVTYDGFQSSESVSLFRKAGVRASYVSMDTTPEPYQYLRRTFYEDRMDCIESELLRSELISLEWTKEMKKLDHPRAGSKDVSDAVAGAVFALSKLRSTRSSVLASSGDHKERVRIKKDLNVRPEGRERPMGQNLNRRR